MPAALFYDGNNEKQEQNSSLYEILQFHRQRDPSNIAEVKNAEKEKKLKSEAAKVFG